jgi:molybdenum cofactor cytidylyltransferase
MRSGELTTYGTMPMPSVTSIVSVILAAGDSTRMGYPKALLPFGTELFITHILGMLRNLGFPRPVIVLGRSAPIVLPQVRNWPADIRINHDPDRGQLSSIQLGLSSVGSEYSAAMIWPVDQPAVSEDLVRRLVQLFMDSGSLIACPGCSEKRGHPAIFHRTLFQEFMDAPLDEGSKKILLRHQHEIALLPTEESGTILDIDTPADYQALTGENLESALARSNAPRIF